MTLMSDNVVDYGQYDDTLPKADEKGGKAYRPFFPECRPCGHCPACGHRYPSYPVYPSPWWQVFPLTYTTGNMTVAPLEYTIYN